jgi:transposase-like protein
MTKPYSKEFKEMAVDLSYNSDKPLSLLAKELGITESAIYNWRKKMSPDSTTKSTESKEVKELKKKLANLEVQNEILKKALAICNKI